MRLIQYGRVIVLFFVLMLPNLALADDLDDVRNVITSQIEAFKRDDAAGAYAFAAPIIQHIFPDEDIFIDMVKRGYPQVYRPQSYAFGTAQPTDSAITQTVILTDADGKQWQALYTLERQPDGSWKISSCRILRSDGVV